MTANSQKVRDSLADQLASFEGRMSSVADDVDLIADIQEGIGRLLASSEFNEDEIRRVLKERYKGGELRKETFQLVESVLDQYVTEQLPTSPLSEDDDEYEPEQSSGGRDDAADFSATQKIDMEEVVGSDKAPDIVEKEFSAEIASIPLITDFDPLEADEPEDVIDAPDIRVDAARVMDDSYDAPFTSTTVIEPDELSDKAATEPPVQVGTVLRDRFLLHEKVAGGSMGVVYKAMDRRMAEAGSSAKWVAIKVLSPQFAKNGQALRALQQEAAKGRCLVHQNIVRFIDLDREGDLYFIVMEWLEGRTLAEILDTEERDGIDADTAFRIVWQIGNALDYAHRCGIVHADVKPGNIMIMPNGDAKLFDFGVARVQQTQEEGGFDPGVLGALTPAYSSMQVLTGEEPVASDDVFSLGCLLYRLVAGYRVFGPRNAAEASQAAMTPQRVAGFNDNQWSAVKKALSYSRVTRFDSIKEFLAALEDTSPASMKIEVPKRFIDLEERRSGRLTGLLGLLAIVLGGAAWYEGYLDPWIEMLTPTESTLPAIAEIESPVAPVAANENPAELAEAGSDSDDAALGETTSPREAAIDERDYSPLVDSRTVGPTSRLVDFSTLPEPMMIIPVSTRGAPSEEFSITVREDGEPAIIDFVRDGDLSTELHVRLEEIGFSGNRSPWAGGEFTLSNAGVVRFPVGQSRGRITLTMASDTESESDQQSMLRLRDLDFAQSRLATLQVTLEDDDRRDFEASLPANTVAFSISQAAVSETDPAVQLDLIRLNPDDNPTIVAFSVEDITATEGEDYFAPGSSLVSFGPRQRTARLLIPLVQDAIREGDEAFVVTLEEGDDISSSITRNVLVRILDDEPQDAE